jgi:hydrogenase small subunit
MNSLFGKISRREFVKFCTATAATLDLAPIEFVTRLSNILAAVSKKPAVIWLEGQDCAGCTVSFAGSLNPPIASIILDKLSLRYHDTIMNASGHQAEEVFNATVNEGGYILAVEGSIPTIDDRFCMVGGRPFKEMITEASVNAAAIIAVGACASFGGIPSAGPTGSVGIGKIVKHKSIINLSNCPVQVDHFLGTILYYLTTGKILPLDEIGRPKVYFTETIHDNCRRRSYFEEGVVLTNWNDPKQKNCCLIEKGCKGPETYCDCSVRRWNDGQNYCIDCGAGCKGCAEPIFYLGMEPLFSHLGEYKEEEKDVEKLGVMEEGLKKEVV